jgi:hypothetical protein
MNAMRRETHRPDASMTPRGSVPASRRKAVPPDQHSPIKDLDAVFRIANLGRRSDREVKNRGKRGRAR